MIPDTQVKSGVPVDHLDWISQYIADKSAFKDNCKVIHLGDHWDMPSLSYYDKGKKAMEGRRYMADIQAGNDGMAILSSKIQDLPRFLLRGNHEDRITRAIEADAQLDGLLSLDSLESPGWEVSEFLYPIEIDGVGYAHYFYNPMSGKPYGGMIETRLKQIGHSFTMGHQQTLSYGLRYVGGKSHHGLVAGSCYLHDEDYKGPQGNAHWRGIIVCHEVQGGSYNPMFVSLDFLCRKYEGTPLAQYTPKLYV